MQKRELREVHRRALFKMTFRAWLYVFVIAAICMPSLTTSQEKADEAENMGDRAKVQPSKQPNSDFIPSLEGIESAIRDLVAEESEDGRQRIADQAAQDLAAQIEMAN